MSFADELSNPMQLPAPEIERVQIAPEGGAMAWGQDAEGNPLAFFVPEGVTLPPVGTTHPNDDGSTRVFGSNGWNRGPIDPNLLKMQPKLVPIKKL